jgi:hypothetical protein
MPKNPDQMPKKQIVNNGSDFTIAWPKLHFSPATGETNISTFVKNLEEAIAANFGVHYAVLIRTGKPWVPPIPSYTTVDTDHPHYLFYKDLRKSMISNYATELFKAENVNMKLYGIIWASLSKESKYAIARLPDWAAEASNPLTTPLVDLSRAATPQVLQQSEDAGDDPDEGEAPAITPHAPKNKKKKKSQRPKTKGSHAKKKVAFSDPDDDDPEVSREIKEDVMGPAPTQPPNVVHDPNYISIYSLSSTRLHTLEELWKAILRTHVIEPSGPRKASNDIFQAMDLYHNTKMDARESLSNFKERFTFAIGRVRLVGGAIESEGVATTRFIKALDPGRFNDFWRNLDTSITMGGRTPPNTIEEAFRLAYDSLIKINSSFKYSSVNETSTLLTTSHNKEKGNNKGFKGSKPNHHPGQKKHHQKDNNKRNNHDDNKYKSRNDKDTQKKDYSCHFCNRMGHMQKDCHAYKAARAFSMARHASNSTTVEEEAEAPVHEERKKKVEFDVKRLKDTGRATSYTTWRMPKFPDSDDELSSVLMIQEERDHLHEGFIILDDASGTNIIKDRYLLSNLRRAPKPMLISGIAHGTSITSYEVGDLPYFGLCYYHEKAAANVLCQTRIEDRFPVDYKQGKYFKIHVGPNTIVEFKRNGSRYTCPNNFFVNNATALLSSSSVQPYSKRVQETLKVQRNLAYPALSSLRRFVTRGSMLNMPITGKHVDEAITATNGKTTEELKGKAHPNKEPLPHTERIETTSRTITLHIDVMFILSFAFLLTVSEPMGFTALAYLTKRSWKILGTELVRIINGYKGKQHTVTRIRSDNEGCVVASKDVLEGMGIDVDLCDPESNVHMVESKIRWIKERARTILFSIAYPPPDISIPWLPKFIIHCLNIVQHSRTGLIPREQLTGIRVDYKRDARLCWGDIVEVFKSPQILNSMQTRSVTCIALAPAGNKEGSWHFLSLATGAIIKGYRWQERIYDELTMQAIKDLNSTFQRSRQPKNKDENDKIQVEVDPDFINERQNENLQNEETEAVTNISNDKSIPNEESKIPTDLQTNLSPATGETIPRPNSDFEFSSTTSESENFGTSKTISENPETDFQPLLEGNRRPLEFNDDLETNFEQVGSNISAHLFATESHTTSWCFNISVAEAAKRYPVESKSAMQSEIKQMIVKEVFHPVFFSDIPRSSPHSIIYSSMFLKEKFDLDGALKRLKARLVGGGNMQDRDLYERSSISSPTVAVAAVLIIIAIAATLNHIVYTVDIAGAYLNADIGESNIYMTLDPVVAKIYVELHPERRSTS